MGGATCEFRSKVGNYYPTGYCISLGTFHKPSTLCSFFNKSPGLHLHYKSKSSSLGFCNFSQHLRQNINFTLAFLATVWYMVIGEPRSVLVWKVRVTLQTKIFFSIGYVSTCLSVFILSNSLREPNDILFVGIRKCR